MKRVRKSTIPTSDTTAKTVKGDGFSLRQTDHAGITSTARRGYTAVSMTLMQSYEAGRALHVGMYYKRENMGVKEREYSYAYDNDADDKFSAVCDQLRSGHPCLWLILWDPTQPIATRPLSIQKDGTWYCYGWDLTKNICEVYDQNGYVRTAYTYKPYGSVTSTGDVTQPLQWSSEYTDEELGLAYYNYRHYNPLVGRWLGRDPLEDKNLYNYEYNSPFSFFDIIGLSASLYRGVSAEYDEKNCKIVIVLKLGIVTSPGYNNDYTATSELPKIKEDIEKVWNPRNAVVSVGCCEVSVRVDGKVYSSYNDIPSDTFPVSIVGKGGGDSRVNSVKIYPISKEKSTRAYKQSLTSPDGKSQYMYVHPDSRSIPSDAILNAASRNGKNGSNIFQNKYYVSFEYAHEAGHIMGLPDEYYGVSKFKNYENDIMATADFWSTEPVDRNKVTPPQVRASYYTKIFDIHAFRCPCDFSNIASIRYN